MDLFCLREELRGVVFGEEEVIYRGSDFDT